MTTTPQSDRSGLPPVDRSASPAPDRPADRSDGPVPPAGPPPVRWPLWVALTLIAGVWAAGAWWSFREQTALAQSAGFHVPELLPLVIDGFAVAMAAVAWAASLDGRAAVFARLGIGVGILCSAAANAMHAALRSGFDPTTVVLGGGVPILAMIAFEVLLAEARKQVQRRRGLPAPVALPLPRLTRVVMAPISTLWTWRRLVLERTHPARQFAEYDAARRAAAARTGQQPGPDSPVRTGVRPGRRTGRAPSRRTGRRPGPTAPATQSADRPADPVGDRPADPVGDQSADWGEAPVATVTPIRSRTAGRTGRRTAPTEEPTETAIANAIEVLGRWPDREPSRTEVMKAFGWGAPRAAKALAALDVARRRLAGEPAGDDDEEGASWAG